MDSYRRDKSATGAKEDVMNIMQPLKGIQSIVKDSSYYKTLGGISACMDSNYLVYTKHHNLCGKNPTYEREQTGSKPGFIGAHMPAEHKSLVIHQLIGMPWSLGQFCRSPALQC